VGREITGSRKSLATLSTYVRLLTSVDSHVQRKTGSLTKSLAALLAFMRLFIGVNKDVIL
jgi:hypothetical protein